MKLILGSICDRMTATAIMSKLIFKNIIYLAILYLLGHKYHVRKLHIKFDPNRLNNKTNEIFNKKGVFPPLKMKKLEKCDQIIFSII